MEINELIARINLLYRKRQVEGLTVAEQAEQTELRRQYIDIFKGNLKSQLDRIQVIDEPTEDHCCKPDCDCKKHS
jgi:uncharacterized protein YnzC (UPF0291/DUF896 family)